MIMMFFVGLLVIAGVIAFIIIVVNKKRKGERIGEDTRPRP